MKASLQAMVMQHWAFNSQQNVNSCSSNIKLDKKCRIRRPSKKKQHVSSENSVSTRYYCQGLSVVFLSDNHQSSWAPWSKDLLLTVWTWGELNADSSSFLPCRSWHKGRGPKLWLLMNFQSVFPFPASAVIAHSLSAYMVTLLRK